jgi:hypothetical protein
LSSSARLLGAQAALSRITSFSSSRGRESLSCPSSGEDEAHAFSAEVAALDEPLVCLLDEQRAGEADHGGVVGEDPDDVGAAADLLVDAFDDEVHGAALPRAREHPGDRGQEQIAVRATNFKRAKDCVAHRAQATVQSWTLADHRDRWSPSPDRTPLSQQEAWRLSQVP